MLIVMAREKVQGAKISEARQDSTIGNSRVIHYLT
jgi:hypothetical protein